MLETLDKLDTTFTHQHLFKGDTCAVQVANDELLQHPCSSLVDEIVALPPFMLDLKGDHHQLCVTLDNFLNHKIGSNLYLQERGYLFHQLKKILQFSAGVISAKRILISMRNWFAPGDLAWHVDRSTKSYAVRILWTLGRSEGMYITHEDNINLPLYKAWMRREHPLLCRLDRKIYEQRVGLKEIWRHRPQQVDALITNTFPYIKNQENQTQALPYAVSVHRIEAAGHAGTWHHSAWGNHNTPGIQFIITCTS